MKVKNLRDNSTRKRIQNESHFDSKISCLKGQFHAAVFCENALGKADACAYKYGTQWSCENCSGGRLKFFYLLLELLKASQSFQLWKKHLNNEWLLVNLHHWDVALNSNIPLSRWCLMLLSKTGLKYVSPQLLLAKTLFCCVINFWLMEGSLLSCFVLLFT